MISPLDAKMVHLGGIGQRDAPRQRHVPQLTQGLMRRVVDRGIPGLPSQMPKRTAGNEGGNRHRTNILETPISVLLGDYIELISQCWLLFPTFNL